MNDQLKSILEQQLRDVHTPDAVSWWPLAIGWWCLIALSVSALIFSLFKLLSHRRRNAYRKTAIKELDQAFSYWQKRPENTDYLQAANAILKRACSHFDNQAVSLSGKPWVVYLNSHAKTNLSSESEVALTRELYQEKPTSDITHVHREIQAWLLQHKVTLADQAMELTHA